MHLPDKRYPEQPGWLQAQTAQAGNIHRRPAKKEQWQGLEANYQDEKVNKKYPVNPEKFC